MIKVLIVEDDPMVAELNKRYLSQVEGFCLAGIAGNGAEALAFLENNTVDLILLDLYMPDIDGMQLLNSIRSACHEVDVIMVTAARDTRSIQQALRQGVVDYLIKPFEFERLNAALSDYKERTRLIDESEELDQVEIDRQILAKSERAQGELPKGLDRETLALIFAHIKQSVAPFSTEEMAQQVGVSRVSLRKYLKFLASIGVLEGKLTYRAVGRPIHLYKYTMKELIF